MFTLQAILSHAGKPAACYNGPVPTRAAAADDDGLIEIHDAGYQQDTVYLVRLTGAGRAALARMTRR